MLTCAYSHTIKGTEKEGLNEALVVKNKTYTRFKDSLAIHD